MLNESELRRAGSARTRPVVAIDGPAGAGKSTVAAYLARSFGFLNLETGAMYRALAYKAIDADMDMEDEVSLLDLCHNTTIVLEPTRDGNRVLLDGMDVSRRLRDSDVTAAASRVSVHPRVREWMVAQQRKMGAAGGVIMEGRDIGTAVFPDAEVKIFLDADPEVRGNRRFRQVASSEHEQVPVTEASVIEEMKARDQRDRTPFAADLAGRMLRETSTRFGDWVDHLVIGEATGLARALASLGFARQAIGHPDGSPAFAHPGAMFPRIVVAPGPGPEVREVALKVESIADFSRALDLGLKVVGTPLGPYRVARVPASAETVLAVVERRGFTGFDPFSSEMARLGRITPQGARDALAARDLWQGRRRRFADDVEGLAATEATLARVIDLAGSPDLACHLVFEVERDYWQSLNRAARVQKARQDRLGLGWANHDHHTYRSSRRAFPRLIGMFLALGFALRERYHAGDQAGWGAQILEHPTTGIVIFADLDLAPDEAGHDFARDPLPDLDRPNTVGLWVALHGESILEGGMHHLEAQFDFDALRDDLKAVADIDLMKPFADFPFLRQAFTAGERRAVDPVGSTGPSPSAGSTRTRPRGFGPRGPSAATSRTSSVARGSRGSIRSPSAPSWPRSTPVACEPTDRKRSDLASPPWGGCEVVDVRASEQVGRPITRSPGP